MLFLLLLCYEPIFPPNVVRISSLVDIVAPFPDSLQFTRNYKSHMIDTYKYVSAGCIRTGERPSILRHIGPIHWLQARPKLVEEAYALSSI
jgi:hypothetical protein